MAYSTRSPDPYVEELEARIERLEKAIREMSDASCSWDACTGPEGTHHRCTECRNQAIAREALEGK